MCSFVLGSGHFRKTEAKQSSEESHKIDLSLKELISAERGADELNE